MKKLLLSILFALIVTTSFGQSFWYLNFEDSTYLNKVVIDTTSNPNNIWQIGHPNKTIFTTAYSSPNVIVTDTLNPYPINDTSSFTVIQIVAEGWHYIVEIDGWYFVNSDTLTDYGYIEFSPDHGSTWFNADSTMNHGCCFSGPEELPTFTGNSFGWQHFHYCLCTPTALNVGDTVLYRFTFISDNIQTNKDGLMFDDLQFTDMVEGIDKNENNNLISLFPNPATSELIIENGELKIEKVELYNAVGEKVFEKHLSSDVRHLSISVADFTPGIYFIIITDQARNKVMKKVVKM